VAPWLYAILCLLMPAVWAVVVSFALDAIARRRRRETDQTSRPPPIDYVI
jgi:hypothetical protein